MPTAALACVARETLRLSDIVQKMLHDTLEAFRSNNPAWCVKSAPKKRPLTAFTS